MEFLICWSDDVQWVTWARGTIFMTRRQQAANSQIASTADTAALTRCVLAWKHRRSIRQWNIVPVSNFVLLRYPNYAKIL